MTTSAQAIALRSRNPLRLVAWASIAYLVLAAVHAVQAVLTLEDRLGHARTGIRLGFDPQLPVPEPPHDSFSGAAYVVPGTTMYLDHATGTVAHVPSASIALQSAGDLVGIFTGAGVALCVLLLVRWIIQGKPFVAAATRVLVALAIVVMIGFESESVLHFAGSNMLTTVLFGKPEQPDGMYSLPGGPQVIIGFVPLYIGAALLGLAAVFRVGAQLQRETDGLV
ncbi:MAG TPA: hypothetical protein VGC45_12130 [Gryllotalpicola sp.]